MTGSVWDYSPYQAWWQFDSCNPQPDEPNGVANGEDADSQVAVEPIANIEAARVEVRDGHTLTLPAEHQGHRCSCQSLCGSSVCV